MPEAVIHPTPQELADFGRGKLAGHAAAAVAAHLETCHACRSSIAKVRAADPDMPILPCPDVPPELARHPKYFILRELGRGGMGVVYQARHKEMDRQVVIKVINRTLLDRPDSLERFHREVRAAALLSHPNIVTAFDAERVGDAHMLVMEFVPGQSLAEVVQKRGPLPLAHGCHYARQVALGLQHAYERNMVHRDIKPQNLMLSLKNQIKILDFGLAKVAREGATGTGLTSHNVYLGTPEYCAPEQAADARTADIRADLYSLGCTLYFLLSGRPPFRETTIVNTILAHLQKQPRPLPELRPDVPVELWQLVAKLLAKEPAQRYQKPIEAAQALAPFIKGASKSDTKSATVSVPSGESPGEGTRIAADAGEIKKILREVSGKTPSKQAPSNEKNDETKRMPPGWFWRWVMLAGLNVLVLTLLGMWALGVFKGKTLDGNKEATQKKAADPLGPIVNSIGMKFVLVKPGTFLMGSPKNERGRYLDELQHTIEITRPFYMGVYEVTQEQYERIIGQNRSWFSTTGDGKNKVLGMATSQFPVESVSWNNAVQFCRLLSELPEEKMKERSYRLPTEAEWEYCCRDGHFYREPSPLFHFGNSLSSEQANFDGNWPFGDALRGRFLERPARIGAYAPNRLGLYDLHGNVQEWCSDWFDEDYYKQSPLRDPQGPDRGERRVLRGGCWNSNGNTCRAAYRYNNLPAVHDSNNGFRVVCDVRVRP